MEAKRLHDKVESAVHEEVFSGEAIDRSPGTNPRPAIVLR